MSAAGQSHTVIELVGGPFDGQRFIETTELKITHNTHHVYDFGGAQYRPWKLDSDGVLKLRYVGDEAKAHG